MEWYDFKSMRANPNPKTMPLFFYWSGASTVHLHFNVAENIEVFKATL